MLNIELIYGVACANGPMLSGPVWNRLNWLVGVVLGVLLAEVAPPTKNDRVGLIWSEPVKTG